MTNGSTMVNLVIPATDITPAIDFSASSCVLKMNGESYPENVGKFYEPVYQWLEAFFAAGKGRAVVAEFELTMFNSSTAKALMNIIEMLEEGAEGEDSVTLNWRFHESNDLVEEFGEDLQEDYPALAVNMVPLSE